MNKSALYKWRVVYTGGEIAQDDFDNAPKDSRFLFDPNKPQTRFGVPVRVELISQVDNLEPHQVDIPPGCLPCRYYRTIELYFANSASQITRCHQIGYNANGRQVSTLVNVETGEVVRRKFFDEDGFRIREADSEVSGGEDETGS